MTKRMGFFILIFSVSALAEIQVPENCAGNVSPCLIRAKDEFFHFKHEGYEGIMPPEAILKISKTGQYLHFDVLRGGLWVKASPQAGTAFLNSVILDSEEAMVTRKKDTLRVLNLSKFTLSEYELNQIQGESFSVRVKSVFLSKGEFVEFTRFFFYSLRSFRGFLSKIEKDWAREFKAQNENQTKALLRSVASEEQAEEQRVQQKLKEQSELKKVKKDFFFRTFQR